MHYVCTHNFQVSSQCQVCFMSKDIFIFMQHNLGLSKQKTKKNISENYFFFLKNFNVIGFFF